MLGAALLVAGLWLADGAGEALRFVDLEGRAVTVAPPAAGEAVVVHFWATWCPTCGPELGTIERAARACAGSRVRVLAANAGESADDVRDFLSERGLEALPVVLDPKGRAWRAQIGRELPANLVWTAEERRVAFGPGDEVAWRERLAALGCAPGGQAPGPPADILPAP